MSERLSDLDLDALIQHGCSSGTSTAPMVRDAIIKAGLELRARRAADLTEADRAALRHAQDVLRFRDEPFDRSAIAVLDKLLGKESDRG